MPELDTMETLEFPCDPSTLPTTSTLPVGELLLKIVKIEVKKTKENTDGAVNEKTGQLKVGGKKCVNVQFSLYEPEEIRGIPHTKMFVLGSDADPGCEKQGTWVRNGTLLMQMFEAANVGGKTFAEYVAAATDAIVGADVRVEKSKDKRWPDKNTPKAFWKPGKKAVHLVEPQAGEAELDAAFGGPAVDSSMFSNKG